MSYTSSIGSSSTWTVTGIVSQLMNIERQPLRRLQTKRSDLTVRAAVFSDLQTKIRDLRTQAQAVADTIDPPFGVKTTNSSDSDVLAATAASGAVVGTHDVFVEQLAKSHTMISDRKTLSGTDIVDNVGAGTQTFSVTINDVATEVSVTISAGEDDETVLGNIASAINDAMSDVDDAMTASLLKDTTTTGKLVLRSDDTGTTYKMALADVSGGLLNYLGIDDETTAGTDTTGGYIYADGELDAKITVGGVSITRDSNSIDDALDGVTLNLLGFQEQGANEVSLTVSADVASVRTSVEELLTTYNETLAYLRAKTTVDADTYQRGALAGDYTYHGLMLRLRSAMSDAVSGVADGAPDRLSVIGITAAADGSLSITDADDFADAVEANPDHVADLFNLADGVANRIDDLLDPFAKVGGILDGDADVVSDRIDTIDESIERMEEQLALKERKLTQQYSQLQQMLSLFQSQQQILNSIQALL